MIRHNINPILKNGFAASCRFLLKRQFADVLLDRESYFGGAKPWPREAGLCSGLFFIVSHTSWWDAILAGELCLNQQNLRAIGPMDSAQLKKNGILKRVGIFGTEPGDGEAIERMLDEEFKKYPETCVWVHAQGQFSPNEIDQPPFKTGVSRWSKNKGYHRIPVALHYAFGPAKKPYVFVRLGREVQHDSWALQADLRQLRDALSAEVQALLKNVTRAHSGTMADYSGFNSLVRANS